MQHSDIFLVLTDEIDTILGPTKLLNQVLYILLKAETFKYEITSKSIYSIRDHDKNLGWPEKADRFEVLHVVSVL